MHVYNIFVVGLQRRFLSEDVHIKLSTQPLKFTALHTPC